MVDDILKFWFGAKRAAREVAVEQAVLWWGKNTTTDKKIAENYQQSLDKIIDGQWPFEIESPHEFLAAIILTDQFSRNIYRNTANAFAFDKRAVGLCRECIDNELDQQLQLIERVFVYLLLEHSEGLSDQEEAVQKFNQLVQLAAAEDKETFEQYALYAERHYDVIKEFGRFPHRNILLGRSSTPAEERYLQQEGSGF